MQIKQGKGYWPSTNKVHGRSFLTHPSEAWRYASSEGEFYVLFYMVRHLGGISVDDLLHTPILGMKRCIDLNDKRYADG
jgi:hypothetical protein